MVLLNVKQEVRNPSTLTATDLMHTNMEHSKSQIPVVINDAKLCGVDSHITASYAQVIKELQPKRAAS